MEKWSYFKDLWNLIDVSALLLVLFTLVMTISGTDAVKVESLRVFAAIASCLTFMKFFDWLRLFE